MHARSCYGHLAGEVAVDILEAMVKARWLKSASRDYVLTRTGESRLTALGIDLAGVAGSRRVFARSCLDLTQRRPHLGGALGEALLDLYVAHGWARRQPRSRVIHITPGGQENFRRVFGV